MGDGMSMDTTDTTTARADAPTLEEVLGAVRGSYGIIERIAARLGCTRRQLYACMARWPEVVEAIEEERPRIRDLAEQKLVEAIEKGSLRAIQIAIGPTGALWDRAEVRADPQDAEAEGEGAEETDNGEDAD